jgi:hypothetical protein
MLQKILGIVFLGAACWFAADAVTLRSQGLIADAVIVGESHHEQLSTDGYSLTHAPIFEFVPADQRTPVRVRSDMFTAWHSYHPGDTVRVRYFAAHPESARIDSVLRDALMPLLLTVLGVSGLRGQLRRDRSTTLYESRWDD